MAYIPARYIGDHEVILDIAQLQASGHPLTDGYGKPLTPNIVSAVEHLPAYGLRHGDTLMMPDSEVLGQTYLHDSLQQNPSEFVGVGKVIKKEHQGLSLAQLSELGYEFSEGRKDFEPLLLENATTSPQESSVAQFKTPGDTQPPPIPEAPAASVVTNADVSSVPVETVPLAVSEEGSGSELKVEEEHK